MIFSSFPQAVSLRIRQHLTPTTPAESSLMLLLGSRSESKHCTLDITPPTSSLHTSWCTNFTLLLFACLLVCLIDLVLTMLTPAPLFCLVQIRDMDVLKTNVFKGQHLFLWHSSGNMAEIEFHGDYLRSKGSFRAEYSLTSLWYYQWALKCMFVSLQHFWHVFEYKLIEARYLFCLFLCVCAYYLTWKK